MLLTFINISHTTRLKRREIFFEQYTNYTNFPSLTHCEWWFSTNDKIRYLWLLLLIAACKYLGRGSDTDQNYEYIQSRREESGKWATCEKDDFEFDAMLVFAPVFCARMIFMIDIRMMLINDILVLTMFINYFFVCSCKIKGTSTPKTFTKPLMTAGNSPICYPNGTWIWKDPDTSKIHIMDDPTCKIQSELTLQSWLILIAFRVQNVWWSARLYTAVVSSSASSNSSENKGRFWNMQRQNSTIF